MVDATPTSRRQLVVFSGAGLSADSGVPTYRDAGGLWEGYDFRQLATLATWRANAGAVRRFYDDRRVKLGTVEPNPAHRLLADWQRRFGATLVTQNVDDLLERAGAADVLHVHGRLTEMRCLACGRTFDIGYRAWGEGERCACRSADEVKPGVVFFGETAPGYGRMGRLFRGLTQRDVLVVIGTGGEVVDIGAVAAATPAATVLSNLESSPTIDDDAFDVVLHGRAAEMAPTLDNAVSSLMA